MNAGKGSWSRDLSPGYRRFLLAVASLLLPATLVSADQVIIGSKKFTESYVLAEIAKRSLENAGLKVEHRQGMGGTIILWEALRGGGIDVYPEYTGTIAEEMLKEPGASIAQIRNALSAQGIAMTDDLGFNNTYALVMRRDRSEQLGLKTISDLRAHRELKFGLTHEFLERRDGWRPMSERYQLAASQVLGIDHALGYAALAKGEIDVKDAYSTDAKIGDYGLVTLIDDLHFFPQYKAVFLYRKKLSLQAVPALNDLSNSIDETRMIRLNSEAERTKNYAAAAQQFFGTTDGAITTPFVSETFRNKLLRWVT
ncbi:MAG: glycine/betaine ABC transporter substrate-binding protein, partial [Verrucomicrobia bacterium]